MPRIMSMAIALSIVATTACGNDVSSPDRTSADASRVGVATSFALHEQDLRQRLLARFSGEARNEIQEALDQRTGALMRLRISGDPVAQSLLDTIYATRRQIGVAKRSTNLR